MDIATIGGIVLAFLGIVGGLILEGGNIGQITQPTAALIVLGGTFGATMVSCPLDVFLEAMKNFKFIFSFKPLDPGDVIENMVKFSAKARKEGIIALNSKTEAPIIPLIARPQKYYTFEKAWNKARFPYPFTKITLNFGKFGNYNAQELQSTLLSLDNVD